MPAIDAASDAGLAPRLHPSRRRGQGAAADGYDRWSTLLQDLTSQREVLTALGIPVERICLDKGLTGINRARISLDQTLAAVPAGDTGLSNVRCISGLGGLLLAGGQTAVEGDVERVEC
ncbi:hypothetical protein, partial [Actinocatenispora sera]|uniref:hypothetical protein n=1 Tax=Actinocatenispora sera TaxID=390989 RepID=UPI003CCB93AA